MSKVRHAYTLHISVHCEHKANCSPKALNVIREAVHKLYADLAAYEPRITGESFCAFAPPAEINWHE